MKTGCLWEGWVGIAEKYDGTFWGDGNLCVDRGQVT